MHLVILFQNIGGYHAARLQAVHQVCTARAWQFTALQLTHQTAEHPWGSPERQAAFPIHTLLPNHRPQFSDDRNLSRHPITTALKTALNQLQPTVMAIPGWGFIASQMALRWCRRQGVPTILMSESKQNDEPRQWWKEQLKSWLWVRQYDAALVGGQLHQDYLVQLGLPESLIFRGYDVVDNAHFTTQAAAARQNPTALRSQLGIPSRPYFLSVTRLIPRKNLTRLLTAYAQYCRNMGPEMAWDLVICGSGDQAATLHQQRQALGLENRVHFPGFQSYDAIGAWYGLAEAFIHPALQEQWGLVINEACAAGLPILCSRTVGAAPDLVQDGHNGLLFEPTAVEEITQALIQTHQQVPHLRYQQGVFSQQIIAQHAPQHFAQGMMAAIATTHAPDRP